MSETPVQPDALNVLVTSARMPFALDEIRKLGKLGHRVFAADTFGTAPGQHSRYTTAALQLPSPRYETAAFVDAVRDTVRRHDIDLVVPTFEEVFYLARHLEPLSQVTKVFAAPFEVLAQLHDKGRLLDLADTLDIPTPPTRVVDSLAGWRAALVELGRDGFFARPVFSRGGVNLVTNRGPLAGAVDPDTIEPDPEHPWLVQGFVTGTDVCTLSIAHRGHIAAHSTYVHPRELEHAGGIVFVSVDEPQALEYAQRIVEATGFTGQIAFDFLRTPAGLVLIECNPRATNGAVVMSPELFVDALLERHPGETRVAPPGVERKIGIALIRDMVMHPGEIPEDLRYLLSDAPDVYAEAGDRVPALYSLLSYSHVLAYRLRGQHTRSDLMAGYFDDICWNGEPIAPPAP